MSKLSTLDNPLERISGTDASKENPFTSVCSECKESLENNSRPPKFGMCRSCFNQNYRWNGTTYEKY